MQEQTKSTEQIKSTAQATTGVAIASAEIGTAHVAQQAQALDIVQFHGAGDGCVDIDGAASGGFSGSPSRIPHQDKLETAFGTKLDHIQFYAGAEASSACQALNAEAYCVGNRIAAASPNISEFVMAHELAHTFQQAGGVMRKATVGAVGDRWETQADQAALTAVSGGRVDVAALMRSPSTPTVQRNPPPGGAAAAGGQQQTQKYRPGPTTGVDRGLFPRNVTALSFNIGDDLYNSVVRTARFPPNACDAGWYGWGQLRQFCDQNNWERNLSITQTKQLEVSKINVTGTFTITVRPRLAPSPTYLGPGDQGTIASTGSTTGTTTSTNTQTVGGQATGGGQNAPGGVGVSGSGQVSGSTSSSVAGGTTSGGGTTGTVTAATQRFSGSIVFDITVESEYGSAGWTWAVVLVGGIGSEIGAEVMEPGTRTGSSSNIAIRFDLATADCVPA